MNRTEKKELILVGGYFLIFYLSFAISYFFEVPAFLLIIAFSFPFSKFIEEKFSDEKKFQPLVFFAAIFFFMLIHGMCYAIYITLTDRL